MRVDTDALVRLVAEIEACGFECQAGPLKNSAAWRELRERLGILDIPGVSARIVAVNRDGSAWVEFGPDKG